MRVASQAKRGSGARVLDQEPLRAGWITRIERTAKGPRRAVAPVLADPAKTVLNTQRLPFECAVPFASGNSPREVCAG